MTNVNVCVINGHSCHNKQHEVFIEVTLTFDDVIYPCVFWNLRCAVVVYLPAAAVFCLGRLIRHTDCITLSETTNKQTKVEEFGKDVELNYFPPKDTEFF